MKKKTLGFVLLAFSLDFGALAHSESTPILVARCQIPDGTSKILLQTLIELKNLR